MYLYTAVSDGYLKRIVGFKMYTQATCRNYRCAQTTRGMLRLDKTIRALLDSLNVLSILSTRFGVSFVSIKVIHTMHTSIYFVILILYFCEFGTFVIYDPNIRIPLIKDVPIRLCPIIEKWQVKLLSVRMRTVANPGIRSF